MKQFMKGSKSVMSGRSLIIQTLNHFNHFPGATKKS